ncbi:hypothetical protein CAEBREN_06561 [Caenorhabditis brenneri]|uniref:Uncharacterized protein n=1 Tax=Caenorhabditis brenneri TaxID=135651 RepID=G0NF59_CAEBE|nr:hypothetical protein CAEBREN_06561 [Caenorhabditis brenneri]
MNNFGNLQQQSSNNWSIGTSENHSRNLLQTIDFDVLSFEEMKRIVRQFDSSSIDKPIQWSRQNIRSFENAEKMNISACERRPLKNELDWFARENQLINLKNIFSRLQNLVDNRSIEVLIGKVKTKSSRILELLSDKNDERSVLNAQDLIRLVEERSNQWDFNIHESRESAKKCSAEIEISRQKMEDEPSKQRETKESIRMLHLEQKLKCWNTLIVVQKAMKKMEDVEECWNEMRRKIFEKNFYVQKEKARGLVPKFMTITAINWESLYVKQRKEKRIMNIEVPYPDIRLQGIEDAPVEVLKGEVFRLRKIKTVPVLPMSSGDSRMDFAQDSDPTPLSSIVKKTGTINFSIDSIIATSSGNNKSTIMHPGVLASIMALSGVFPFPFPWFPLQPTSFNNLQVNFQSFQTNSPLVSVNPMSLQPGIRKRKASNESNAFEKMPKLNYMEKCDNQEESDIENEI